MKEHPKTLSLLWTATILGVFAVGVLAANYMLYPGAGTQNAAAISEALPDALPLEAEE